jgi:hypothetical protein
MEEIGNDSRFANPVGSQEEEPALSRVWWFIPLEAVELAKQSLEGG